MDFNNFKNINGIIFDADGTLLDSMNIWTEIGKRFLLSKNITIEEELAEDISTLSYEQGAAYYIEHFDPTATVQDIRDGVNALVKDFYFEEVVLKDGVKEFLEELKKRGMKMCVATATDKFLIEKALERNGILPCFSAVLTCGEVGAGKDTAEIYEQALKALGTKKSQTLVFEDAHYAVVTAKNAGFTVVAIEDNAERKYKEKIKSLADFYTEGYADLINRL